MRDWWKGGELETVLQPTIWTAELNCLKRAALAREVRLVYLAQRRLSWLGSPFSWKSAASWQLPAAAPLEPTTATFKLRSSSSRGSTHLSTQWPGAAGLPNLVAELSYQASFALELPTGLTETLPDLQTLLGSPCPSLFPSHFIFTRVRSASRSEAFPYSMLLRCEAPISN